MLHISVIDTNIHTVEAFILADRYVITHEIADQMEIFNGCMETTIHEHTGFKNVCLFIYLVLKQLNTD
jgi:hypothetical protein